MALTMLEINMIGAQLIEVEDQDYCFFIRQTTEEPPNYRVMFNLSTTGVEGLLAALIDANDRNREIMIHVLQNQK